MCEELLQSQEGWCVCVDESTSRPIILTACPACISVHYMMWSVFVACVLVCVDIETVSYAQ